MKTYRIILEVDGNESDAIIIESNSEEEATKEALDDATLGNIDHPELVSVISVKQIP